MTARAAGAPAADDLLCVADSKWVLGHWHMAVMPNGKTFDDFTAIAALMQEELGHARALFQIAEASAFSGVSLEHDRTPTEVRSMPLLDDAPRGWADYVGSTMLAEYATWELLTTLSPDGTVPPALIDKIAQEERFHRLAGIGWIKSFDDEDRRALREHFPRRYAEGLRWFGPQPSAARERFAAVVAETFGEFVPAGPPAAPSGWQTWDAARRRPRGSGLSAALWEMMIPTNADALLARRPRAVSDRDGFFATGT